MGCGTTSKTRVNDSAIQSSNNACSSTNCPTPASKCKHTLAISKSTVEQKCNRCGRTHLVMYLCSLCGTFVCDECGDKSKPCTEQARNCPTGHSMVWHKRLVSVKCRICDKKGNPGYFCKHDNYFICTVGCKKLKKSHLCPNRHSLEWHKLSHGKTCDVCGRRDDRVFECKPCKFISCHYCKELQGSAEKPKASLSRGSKSTVRLPVHSKAEKYRVKDTRESINKRRIQSNNKVNVSWQKHGRMSQENLREMSNVVKDLLRQNANMQASLSSVINGGQKERYTHKENIA
eukprot:TRINITY_DN683_c0_g3_i1.p1 TRINITY_DN683_c0_g3~~TRINITY_DN683_c0_g3_i1.p1  ORF type:complete len:303 (-),score=61.16 TRINITY_DN683_c0_g3_i1:61-927(-)